MASTTEGRAEKAPSYTSSTTDVPAPASDGQGESAIPADKEEEAVENIVDDWETDPDNARNWPKRKKWLMVFIVRTNTHRLSLTWSLNTMTTDSTVHAYTTTGELYDGTWPLRNRYGIPYN